MSRWFRLYDEVLDDPKVQRLPDRLFKTWINILCAASRNGGAVPPLPELAFMLRREESKLIADLAALSAAGLLDQGEGKVTPHNWSGRQFQSDGSTDRVKRFRNSKRNTSPAVAETPPETETHTEPEKVAAQPSASAAENGQAGKRPDPLAVPIALWRSDRSQAWFDQVEAEAREAAGLENEPSPSICDISPLVTLIDQGFDFSRDILPKLRAAKASGKRGRSWSYYVPAITEGKATNGKIAAKSTPTGKPADVWINNEDPKWPQAAHRWEKAKGKPPPVLAGSHGNTGQGWHFPADMVAQ